MNRIITRSFLAEPSYRRQTDSRCPCGPQFTCTHTAAKHVFARTVRPDGSAARKLLLVFTNMHFPPPRPRRRISTSSPSPLPPTAPPLHASLAGRTLFEPVRASPSKVSRATPLAIENYYYYCYLYGARSRHLFLRRAMFMLMTFKQNLYAILFT